jgi:hypothetical protein
VLITPTPKNRRWCAAPSENLLSFKALDKFDRLSTMRLCTLLILRLSVQNDYKM